VKHLDPPAKTFDKGGHSFQPERIFKQTMTAFGMRFAWFYFYIKGG